MGGYLAGFRRKHFVFDTAIHWLNQYGPGGILDKLFNAIGSDYPKAVEQQRIRRYKGEKFDYLLTNQPDEMTGSADTRFSGRKKGDSKTFSKSAANWPLF